MYLGLQAQLYEPWVLLQEAFLSQVFICEHSSMSDGDQEYHVTTQSSPLNPNKQVHTKDPFVFWQVAFRWQLWVFFWHSSISKKILQR